MYSNTFKSIGNFVKAALLTGAFIFSQTSSLWASGAPELTEAEMEIVYRVSNYENAGLTQTEVKLLPKDQRILISFGAVLECDSPALEALYHVLKPQPITLEEYQVYQGLVQKDASLLEYLHEDLRKPMGMLVEQKLSSPDTQFFNQDFKVIPRMIGHYTHVRRLDLSNNQLKHLPAEISQLSALEELYLDNNQLTHLPAEIGQLSALKVLVLSNNQLTHLPAEIGQLSALWQLVLSNNQLTHLPAEIGQLSALEELVLSNNQLTHLPAIAHLPALVCFSFSGNPLLDGLDTN